MSSFIIPNGSGLAFADGVADGSFLKKSGSSLVASAVRVPTLVKLGTDRTTTLTGFTDVTGLSFSAVANQAYLLRLVLIFQSAATTTGIGWSFTGPASPTNFVTFLWTATGPVSMGNRIHRAFGSGGNTGTIDTADADSFALIEGLFRNGANAGTVQLQFASEVGGSQVTTKAGSTLRYMEID